MSLICEKYADVSFYGNGVLKSINFKPTPDFNFAFDVVDAIAEKDPYRRALIYVSNEGEERSFTFGDIRDESARAANYFLSLGIKKGDAVILILKRHFEYWFSVVALHKIGAVAIPATSQLTQKDLVYRFNMSKAKAVICTADGEIADHVDAALPESPTVGVRIIVRGRRSGWHSFDDQIKEQSPLFPRPAGEAATNKDDLMLMYFTSGTTSNPKIAAQNYTYPLGHIVTARYWHNVDPDGIHFTMSETGWAKAAWGKIYGQWLCETCVFVYDFDKFSAHNLLECLNKYRITTFCAPPTVYRFLIKETPADLSLPYLKYATMAGEALNPEVYNRFKEYTGITLMEGFGQSETTLVIGNLVGARSKPGSMGLPNPQYDVDLVDTAGKSVVIGEVGEIVIRTDRHIPCGLFSCYYNDEEKTKAAWHDGMYHTGDMAWCDEEGYFWFEGRIDDLIKSSGYRISPFEIESVLMEHPAVLECAVTGVPDPVRGQAIKASVVVMAAYEANEALAEELKAFVKKTTAPYKYPRIIEFLPELPKTVSGKIRRVELKERPQEQTPGC